MAAPKGLHNKTASPANNAGDEQIPVDNRLTHWGQDKMDAISQTIFFKCIFLNKNVSIAIKNLTEICSQGSN